ncbi:MAG: YfhO family protein, partial [Anaerolineales bacterium]|nr:YfhO family protein [Anaerolineales bacterium]
MAEKLGRTILRSGWKPLLIGLLGLVAVQPLFNPAMTCSDDGGLLLCRLVELDHCLRQGTPWPRWTPDLVYGYGYPLFNFFPLLSFYPAEFFHLLGLSFAQAWNAALALYILLSGMTMYLFVKDIFGETAAWVAAVAYMYAPYQLYNALNRGNLGEALALPLLPLILWAFRRLIIKGEICYLVLSALSYAALILTHNVIGLVFTPFLLLYVIALWLLKIRSPKVSDRGVRGSVGRPSPNLRIPRSLWLIGAALLLALGLSAFFWLPAFFEKQWVKIHLAYTPAGMNYRYNFLSLGELLSPPTPVHTSLMNPAPPRSLGLVQLGLTLLAMAGWWSFKDREKRFNVLFFSLVLISLIFMVLPQSVAVWDHLPLLEYVQFPWRFLGIASLAAALLAGAAISLLSDRVRFVLPASTIVLAVEALVIAFSLPWLYPRYCSTTKDLSIANLAQLERGLGVIGATSAGEYLPIWVKEVPSESSMEAMYRAGVPIERLEPSSLPEGAEVKSAEYGLTSADILIESPQPFRAVFNTFYFPGWRAYVDGKRVPIVPTESYGLISFEVPAGESNLQVRFQDTPLRLAAKALSALSALVVLALVIWSLVRWSVGRMVSSMPARNTQYAIRNTFCSFQGVLAVVLLLTKVVYIDRHDNWFRREGFDGVRVEGVQVPLEVNFDGEMTLLGYDLRPATVEAGESFRLDLYWKARHELNTEYSAYARLKDVQANLWSPKDSRRPGGYRDYPATTTWPLDEYAQDSYQILVLPGTPPGEYDLVVGAFSQATLEELDVLDEQGIAVGTSLTVGKLTVVQPRKPPSIEELEMQYPVAIGFGEELELMGYDIDRPAVQAGEGVHLTLFWRGLKEMNQRYAVLLQLANEGGGVVAEEPVLSLPKETFPVASEAYPTTRWQAGEVVRSQHYFPVPAETSAGRHRLQLAVIDREGMSLAAAVDLGELEIEVPERRMALPIVVNPMEINLGDEVTFLGYDLSATVVKPGDTLR